MEPTALEDNSIENYRRFFQSLEPDGGGMIHVSTFKEILKKGMGEKYDEKTASDMISEISPIVDGKISVEGLAETFSMGPRSSKLALSLYCLLEYCPELLPTPDLRQVFDMFGINITSEEAYDVIKKARESFADCLEKRLQEKPQKNKNELKEMKIELMKKLEEQIVLNGGTVPNLEDVDIESDQ